MQLIKFKKISDENNSLGFNEITIFDKQISRVLHQELRNVDNEKVPGDVYFYEFLTICDTQLIIIDEAEWEVLMTCYEVVE